MNEPVNCANFGLRVIYRLKKTDAVINTDFTGPDKADASEALIASMRAQCDYIVTQVFIPETENA